MMRCERTDPPRLQQLFVASAKKDRSLRLRLNGVARNAVAARGAAESPSFSGYGHRNDFAGRLQATCTPPLLRIDACAMLLSTDFHEHPAA